MLKKERQNYILERIKKQNKLSTNQLSIELNTSEDTIRRDFEDLHRQKLIEKVYGGAILVEEKSQDVFNIPVINKEKKYIVAEKAIQFLEKGQVIIISGGTTNMVFAKLIPDEFSGTIYTYSLPIAMQLSRHPNAEIIFIGGKLDGRAMVTVGIDVVKVLSKINADLCFMGVSGIDLEHGLTERGYDVSIVKKAMIEASKKTIALFTSEKIKDRWSHKVCDTKHLAGIVTDLNPASPKLLQFKDSIRVIV